MEWQYGAGRDGVKVRGHAASYLRRPALRPPTGLWPARRISRGERRRQTLDVAWALAKRKRMAAHPPEWHTAQVRAWLVHHPASREWINERAQLDIRILALRLCASNAAGELSGVDFDLVDWPSLVASIHDVNSN